MKNRQIAFPDGLDVGYERQVLKIEPASVESALVTLGRPQGAGK